jgi:hypothetical protein
VDVQPPADPWARVAVNGWQSRAARAGSTHAATSTVTASATRLMVGFIGDAAVQSARNGVRARVVRGSEIGQGVRKVIMTADIDSQLLCRYQIKALL